MQLSWSDEARLLARPFATYRALAARNAPSWREALIGPVLLSLTVACFVSWTTSARLLLVHLALAPVSWAFVPVIQVAALLLTARVWRLRAPTPSLVGLYFRGHLPWLLLIMLLSLLCLLPGGSWSALKLLAGSGALAVLTLVAVAWCVLLTLACFRALCRSRRAALGVTATFYAAQVGLGVAYYAATEQLQPILGAMP
jgi:hypothetical protein